MGRMQVLRGVRAREPRGAGRACPWSAWERKLSRASKSSCRPLRLRINRTRLGEWGAGGGSGASTPLPVGQLG